MTRWLLVFGVALAFVPHRGVARAQVSVIVVTQSHGAGDPPAELGRLSQRIEAQLRLRGAALISLSRDRRGGAAPATPYDTPEAARAALEALSDRAVDALARGENQEAAGVLDEARALIDADLEGLARTTDGMTRVIDTCLFGTRLSQVLGREAEARERTQECRRWAPTALPSPRLHPPEVRALLEDIDRETTGTNAGTLDVDADTPRCLVRINGAPIGRTPARSLRLPRGEYSVQVECRAAEIGAIHRVTIGDEPVHLRVDAGLQEAAHSWPCLGLRYPDAATAASRALGHARGLARVAGASQLLLVRPEGEAGQHALLLLDVATGDTLSEETLVSDADDASLAEVLLRVAQTGGRMSDGAASSSLTPAEAVSRDAAEEPPVGTYPPITGGARVAGFSLLGAAGLATAIAAAYLVHLGTNVDQYAIAEPTDFDFGERRDALDTARLMVIALSATGAALSSAGAALLVPGAHSTPLWAWISGAAGLGAIGGGIALMATAPSCDGGAAPNRPERDDCGARAQSQSLGVLLASIGAPLVMVPVTYLLRSPTNATEDVGHATLQLRVNATGATLSLQGHL